MNVATLNAVKLALSLSRRQRLLCASPVADLARDHSATYEALRNRGIFNGLQGCGWSGIAHCRLPGTAKRTELGERIARILWGRFYSDAHIALLISEKWGA